MSAPSQAGLRPVPTLLVALVVAAAALLAVVCSALATGDNILLVDAGPLARHGAPVAAVVSDLAAALTLGGSLVAGWMLQGEAARTRALVVVAVCAGVWTVAQVLAVTFSYAIATGQPVGSPRFGSDVPVFLGTDLGIWLIAGVIVAAATTSVAVLGSSLGLARGVAVLAGLGIFTKAMTGHAAGDANHEVATSTMLVHLLAVGVWVGALAVLQLIPPPEGDSSRVIRRYSHLALIAWIALLISGVWALSVRMNSPADILTSLYVQIALAKALLLALLGFFGLQQRLLLADRVRSDAGKIQAYRRLAVIELALMGLAIGLAAAMSSSPPPADDAAPLTGTMAILSGYPLPDAPSIASLLTAWRPDAFAIAAVSVALLVWWRPTGPARSRRDSIRLLVGGGLLILLLSGPLAVYAKALVSAHALLLAALLLAVGPIAGGLLTIPTALQARVAALPSRGRTVLLAIIGILPGAMLVIVYSTPLVRATLEGHAPHLALTYLAVLAGALPVLGARLEEGAGGTRRAATILLLAPVLLVIAGGVTLATTGDLVSAGWFGSTGRTWWRDALADQHRGGIAVAVLGLLAGPLLLVGRRRAAAAPRD